MTGSTAPSFGALLRQWRERRRVSQLDLASDAGVSARHVSFIETGRARPSREMVLRLAKQLDVPLRERNPLLLAAGYAPDYAARSLEDEDMTPVRGALDKIISAYEPYPALAVDRHWNLVAANAALALLIADADDDLLEPPVNVLRLSLHPRGLAPAILNLDQWREHLLERLGREVAATADAELAALHRELLGYPGGPVSGTVPGTAPGAVLAVPLRLQVRGEELSFISTVTTFGTAIDITMAELSIEAFLPADASTAQALSRLPSATG